MEIEKMIDTVIAYSPIERQIDMYGCEIGVSRQWYNETTDILMDINKGVYRKIIDGDVVLTKEELEQRNKETKELKIANNNLIFQLQCHDDEVQRLMKENEKLKEKIEALRNAVDGWLNA